MTTGSTWADCFQHGGWDPRAGGLLGGTTGADFAPCPGCVYLAYRADSGVLGDPSRGGFAEDAPFVALYREEWKRMRETYSPEVLAWALKRRER